MQTAKCLECLLQLALTHFLAKTFFQRVLGVYIKFAEITEWWEEGYFCVPKMEIQGGGPRGTCLKFPPWLGYGYFLELHVHIASHDNHEKNQFMGFLFFPIWIWGSTINILATIEKICRQVYLAGCKNKFEET